MLSIAVQKAHWLDGWLHENVGRPYTAILGIGLVIAIIDSIGVLGHTLSAGADGGGAIGTVFALVFQGALLINQMAQWHEHRAKRRDRKTARR